MNIDDVMPVILNLVHMDFCCFYLFVYFLSRLNPSSPVCPLEVPAYGHDYPFTAQTWDATQRVLMHRLGGTRMCSSPCRRLLQGLRAV